MIKLVRSAVAVVLLVGAATLMTTPAAGATAASGAYTAVTPKRLLDTRSTGGALAARSTRLLTVTGGVVPDDASAVVVTVTATVPTAGGYLTVYPAGTSRPAASNLNFGAGRTVPNLAVVRVGASGRIAIYNGSSGRTHVLVDVAGYLRGATAPSGQGAFGVLGGARRVLDTRSGSALAPRGTRSFTVTGGGVPSGVSAVLLNVAATQQTAGGWASVYAAGSARPVASTLNFVARTTVANFVVAPVGAGGKVTLYNGSSGSAHFFADVSGYVLAGEPLSTGTLGSLAPARVLDTRTAGKPIPGGGSLTLTLAGRAGVPRSGVSAVVLNLTATQGTRSGHLTVYGSGSRPTVSNVNYLAGQTVPDLVFTPVSSKLTVTIYNGGAGSVHVFADVSGYVLGHDLALPTVSVSRYVRNITDGGSADVKTMHDEGAADATAGSKLVVLHIGAQLNDQTGVQLTAVERSVTYDALKNALNAYLAGFGEHDVDGTGTIAIATNNGGDFAKYSATDRGTDWAKKVVDAVTAPAGVTVAGANDIESSFSSTEAQAAQWESAYLTATSGDVPPRLLYFTGSADGCPATYGRTGTCDYGWTQAQYYALAGGQNPSRIKALPQVYVPEQAVQWANIDAVGGRAIDFAGALTERAACPTASTPGCNFAALPPAQGWAALYHALSTVVTSPSLPNLTDLRVDD